MDRVSVGLPGRVRVMELYPGDCPFSSDSHLMASSPGGVVLTGLFALTNMTFPESGMVMALLALVAGALRLLGR